MITPPAWLFREWQSAGGADGLVDFWTYLQGWVKSGAALASHNASSGKLGGKTELAGKLASTCTPGTSSLAQACVLLHHRRFFGFQDMVCQDPGHGHLNGKLDPPAHGQLQEELSEPELGEVTALLQGFWKARGKGLGYSGARRAWERTVYEC